LVGHLGGNSGYGNFKRLKFLILAGNELKGLLPTRISVLSMLQHVKIGNNTFSRTLPVE